MLVRRKGQPVVITCITLDFGGTLVTGRLDAVTFWSDLLAYLRSRGYRGSVSQFATARNGALERLAKVRRVNRELRLEDLIQGLMLKLRLHPDQPSLEYAHRLYTASFDTQLVPGVETVLCQLTQTYRLAVISNAMSDVPRRGIEKLNLSQFFDVVVVSRDVGIRKPDPEIFRYALANLNVHPSQALHVGDSLSQDVAGAQRSGMRAVWIDTGEAQTDVVPDYVINSILNLPDLVARLSNPASGR